MGTSGARRQLSRQRSGSLTLSMRSLIVHQQVLTTRLLPNHKRLVFLPLTNRKPTENHHVVSEVENMLLKSTRTRVPPTVQRQTWIVVEFSALLDECRTGSTLRTICSGL